MEPSIHLVNLIEYVKKLEKDTAYLQKKIDELEQQQREPMLKEPSRQRIVEIPYIIVQEAPYGNVETVCSSYAVMQEKLKIHPKNSCHVFKWNSDEKGYEKYLHMQKCDYPALKK